MKRGLLTLKLLWERSRQRKPLNSRHGQYLMNIKLRIEPSYKGKHSLGAEMDYNQCTFLVPSAMGSSDICSVNLKFAMMSDCCMPPNSLASYIFWMREALLQLFCLCFPITCWVKLGEDNLFIFYSRIYGNWDAAPKELYLKKLVLISTQLRWKNPDPQALTWAWCYKIKFWEEEWVYFTWGKELWRGRMCVVKICHKNASHPMCWFSMWYFLDLISYGGH